MAELNATNKVIIVINSKKRLKVILMQINAISSSGESYSIVVLIQVAASLLRPYLITTTTGQVAERRPRRLVPKVLNVSRELA